MKTNTPAVIRIAIASTDGIVVNQHFGKAREFLLYAKEEDAGFRRVGSVKTEPLCDAFEHREDRLKAMIHELSGVDAVIVSRIGQEADERMRQAGIPVYVIADDIENALNAWSEYQNKNKVKGNENGKENPPDRDLRQRRDRKVDDNVQPDGGSLENGV